MKIYVDDYEHLVIITSVKTIRVDFPTKINEVYNDVKFIINRNEFLAEYILKNIWRLLYEHKEELNYLFKSLNYV